jgi:hypothetical protein
VIYASDYDLGRLGHAYYDMDHVNYSLSTGSFQAWNSGWHYRNDGVDIEPNDDIIRSNGYHVGFVSEGEWMKYTVDITENGLYSLDARVASENTGGTFHIEVNDEAVTPVQTVNSSAGWTNFYDINVGGIILTEGSHQLKFSIDNNTPFNISSLDFNRIGPADTVGAYALFGETLSDESSIKLTCNLQLEEGSLQNTKHEFSLHVNGANVDIQAVSMDGVYSRTIVLTTEAFLLHSDEITLSYSGNSIITQSGKKLASFSDLHVLNSLYERFILPKRIQAEDYFEMEGFGLEPTTDIGGGFNLGFASPGDYADYLLYSHEETNFELNMRVASQYSSGSFGFYLMNDDSTEVELLSVQVPATGGWQSWLTIEKQVTLPQGPVRLRMKALSGEFNLNWFSFTVANSIPVFNEKRTPVIYPNPVGIDKLKIRLNNYESQAWNVEIFSLAGKMVWSGKIDGNRDVREIDISFMPPGMYLLRISNNTTSHTLKICRL